MSRFSSTSSPLLAAWYGGGPKIARTVIVQGDETVVELAPPVFRVTTGGGKQHALVPVSRTAPVRELKRRAVEALQIAPSDAAGLVLVGVFEGSDTKMLDELETSVEDARYEFSGGFSSFIVAFTFKKAPSAR